MRKVGVTGFVRDGLRCIPNRGGSTVVMKAQTLQSLLSSFSLLFFVLRWSLLLGAFLRSFPRILGARQIGKSLFFFPGLLAFLAPKKYGEKKTDKEKSHKGIWRSDAPEASQGQTRDVPGTPGTFGPDLCVNQY